MTQAEIFTELAMRLMVSFTPRLIDEHAEADLDEEAAIAEIDRRFEANQEARRCCAREALAAASAFMQEYQQVADLLPGAHNNPSAPLPKAGGDSSTHTGGE